ncbi:uncharacterized protein LOC104433093 [Eucalyptus grandis]|uniref:RING-CH-type domain-containing protein n=2 Tax=Eucalyptus grandis TaxID=71139 RepID=A0A059D635_EUCGR|nr:uncharacterized protein LOC104433093 [Eucalyptus grandis]KAK3445169.1 hypothetical protein EUGRSUZ_B02748 [Eucalyptus grandis]
MMASREMSHVDLERGEAHEHHRHHDVGGSDDDDDDSVCFSDADDGSGSCYSQFYSTAGGSYDECAFAGVLDEDYDVEGGSGRPSSASDCSVVAEGGGRVVRVHLARAEGGGRVVKMLLARAERERDCRICHLGLESNSRESGAPIQLGCSCKGDLGAAHKNCAEAWFKIKGNKTCEICNSIARNIAGVNEVESAEQPTNEIDIPPAPSAIPATPTLPSETRNFWQGHRFLNLLLACMVFAFVISWLFHFNVPSS